MADPINVKVCMFVQKSLYTSRWGRKLKYDRLIEGSELGQFSQYSVWLWTGQPGDRGSIPGRGKKGFSSTLRVYTGTDGHDENQFTKKPCNYEENPCEESIYLLV
jgi:hypothetical protein